MSGPEGGPGRLRSARERVSGDAGLAAGTAVGLAAAALHPAGLAVGGALVGLGAGSLRRGAVLGAEFGLVALLAWAALLAWQGTLVAVAGLWPLSGVAVGAGLAVPTLAAVAAAGVPVGRGRP